MRVRFENIRYLHAHRCETRKLHICALYSTGALFCATSHMHTGVNCPGREVHNSPSPSAEVRNKWPNAPVPRVCPRGMDTGLVTFFFYRRQFALRFTGIRYGLDGPGIESWWRRGFPHPSRTALGLTQPPLRWLQGLFLGGMVVTLTTHPPSSAEVKERVKVYIPLLPF